VVRASTADRQVRDVVVHVLVSEANSAPKISGPTSVSAAAGDKITLKYAANDNADDPRNAITWSVEGVKGATIANGILEWTVDASNPGGDVRISITATDDGTPTRSITTHLTVTVEGVNAGLVTALGNDGTPLNPMVIAAFGNSAALPVDLTKPGELMVALGDRTPTISQLAPPTTKLGNAPNPTRQGVSKLLDKTEVIASVRHAYRVLLDLEVPKAAVASGLAWQLMLLFLPGLFLRNDDLFDISGLDTGQEIGDEQFRFRSDATSLRAGAKRWKEGMWMRSVEAPTGPIWIPSANLRSSFKKR